MYQTSESKRTYKEIWTEKWLAIRNRSISLYKSFARQGCPARSYKEIYVCFRGSERAYWQVLLDKNFTHVFMLQDVINQTVGVGVLQLEFTTTSIVHTHLPLASLSEYLEALKETGCKILKVTPFKKFLNLGGLLPKFIPYNCVSLTKQHLGIRAWGRITPKQLFKYLATLPNVEMI